ncbi:Uncharacterised protein g6658 [Pycnogonum litorale]
MASKNTNASIEKKKATQSRKTKKLKFQELEEDVDLSKTTTKTTDVNLEKMSDLLPPDLVKFAKGPQLKNTRNHNMMEKQRKAKMNALIHRLGDLVPDVNSKESKNSILEKACNYMLMLKETNDKLVLEQIQDVEADEINRLKKQIVTLENTNRKMQKEIEFVGWSNKARKITNRLMNDDAKFEQFKNISKLYTPSTSQPVVDILESAVMETLPTSPKVSETIQTAPDSTTTCPQDVNVANSVVTTLSNEQLTTTTASAISTSASKFFSSKASKLPCSKTKSSAVSVVPEKILAMATNKTNDNGAPSTKQSVVVTTFQNVVPSSSDAQLLNRISQQLLITNNSCSTNGSTPSSNAHGFNSVSYGNLFNPNNVSNLVQASTPLLPNIIPSPMANQTLPCVQPPVFQQAIPQAGTIILGNQPGVLFGQQLIGGGQYIINPQQLVQNIPQVIPQLNQIPTNINQSSMMPQPVVGLNRPLLTTAINSSVSANGKLPQVQQQYSTTALLLPNGQIVPVVNQSSVMNRPQNLSTPVPSIQVENNPDGSVGFGQLKIPVPGSLPLIQPNVNSSVNITGQNAIKVTTNTVASLTSPIVVSSQQSNECHQTKSKRLQRVLKPKPSVFESNSSVETTSAAPDENDRPEENDILARAAESIFSDIEDVDNENDRMVAETRVVDESESLYRADKESYPEAVNVFVQSNSVELTSENKSDGRNNKRKSATESKSPKTKRVKTYENPNKDVNSEAYKQNSSFIRVSSARTNLAVTPTSVAVGRSVEATIVSSVPAATDQCSTIVASTVYTVTTSAPPVITTMSKCVESCSTITVQAISKSIVSASKSSAPKFNVDGDPKATFEKPVSLPMSTLPLPTVLNVVPTKVAASLCSTTTTRAVTTTSEMFATLPVSKNITVSVPSLTTADSKATDSISKTSVVSTPVTNTTTAAVSSSFTAGTVATVTSSPKVVASLPVSTASSTISSNSSVPCLSVSSFTTASSSKNTETAPVSSGRGPTAFVPCTSNVSTTVSTCSATATLSTVLPVYSSSSQNVFTSKAIGITSSNATNVTSVTAAVEKMPTTEPSATEMPVSSSQMPMAESSILHAESKQHRSNSLVTSRSNTGAPVTTTTVTETASSIKTSVVSEVATCTTPVSKFNVSTAVAPGTTPYVSKLRVTLPSTFLETSKSSNICIDKSPSDVRCDVASSSVASSACLINDRPSITTSSVKIPSSLTSAAASTFSPSNTHNKIDASSELTFSFPVSSADASMSQTNSNIAPIFSSSTGFLSISQLTNSSCNMSLNELLPSPPIADIQPVHNNNDPNLANSPFSGIANLLRSASPDVMPQLAPLQQAPVRNFCDANRNISMSFSAAELSNPIVASKNSTVDVYGHSFDFGQSFNQADGDQLQKSKNHVHTLNQPLSVTSNSAAVNRTSTDASIQSNANQPILNNRAAVQTSQENMMPTPIGQMNNFGHSNLLDQSQVFANVQNVSANNNHVSSQINQPLQPQSNKQQTCFNHSHIISKTIRSSKPRAAQQISNKTHLVPDAGSRCCESTLMGTWQQNESHQLPPAIYSCNNGMVISDADKLAQNTDNYSWNSYGHFGNCGNNNSNGGHPQSYQSNNQVRSPSAGSNYRLSPATHQQHQHQRPNMHGSPTVRQSPVAELQKQTPSKMNHGNSYGSSPSMNMNSPRNYAPSAANNKNNRYHRNPGGSHVNYNNNSRSGSNSSLSSTYSAEALIGETTRNCNQTTSNVHTHNRNVAHSAENILLPSSNSTVATSNVTTATFNFQPLNPVPPTHPTAGGHFPGSLGLIPRPRFPGLAPPVPPSASNHSSTSTLQNCGTPCVDDGFTFGWPTPPRIAPISVSNSYSGCNAQRTVQTSTNVAVKSSQNGQQTQGKRAHKSNMNSSCAPQYQSTNQFHFHPYDRSTSIGAMPSFQSNVDKSHLTMGHSRSPGLPKVTKGKAKKHKSSLPSSSMEEVNLSSSIFEPSRSITPYFGLPNFSPPKTDTPTYIPNNILNTHRPTQVQTSTTVCNTFTAPLFPPRCQSNLNLNFPQSAPSFGINTIHSHPISSNVCSTSSTSIATVPSTGGTTIPSYSSSSHFHLSNIFPDINNTATSSSSTLSPIKFHHHGSNIIPPPSAGPVATQVCIDSVQHGESGSIGGSAGPTMYGNCAPHHPPPPPSMIHNGMSINSILGHNSPNNQSSNVRHAGYDSSVRQNPHHGQVGPLSTSPLVHQGHTPSFSNVLQTLNFSVQDH